MGYSKKLIKFKNDFEDNTGIMVLGVTEDRRYFHWKRLILPSLNCEDLRLISSYIKYRFSKEGMYTHLAPKIQCYENNLVLTVDVETLNFL